MGSASHLDQRYEMPLSTNIHAGITICTIFFVDSLDYKEYLSQVVLWDEDGEKLNDDKSLSTAYDKTKTVFMLLLRNGSESKSKSERSKQIKKIFQAHRRTVKYDK